MRVGLALALGAMMLAAGCLQAAELEPSSVTDPATLAAGLAPPLFEAGYVFSLLDVPIDATMSIHAEVYLPLIDAPLAGAVAEETFPAVVVMSPYFGAGTGGGLPGHHLYDYLIEAMVPRGYAVVLADTAGQGGSSGCWDFMGPNEVRGAAGLIDGIAQQPWSNGKVGMVGKSYDAMTQIMAASQNPEALLTIVPVAPLTHGYAGMYQGGVHYGGGWHATTTIYQSTNLAPPGADPLSLLGGTPPVAPERYPGWALRVATSPTCVPQNLALSNDPTGAYNAWFVERDLRPSAATVEASVFFMQGFLDANVKPDNLLPYFSELPGKKKAWLGQWYHDYPNATWAGREDMYLTMHRWFDHELKGIDNGIDREPVVDVQDSLGRWRHEDAWPPADATVLAIPAGDATVGGPASAAGDDGAALELAGTSGIHVAGLPLVKFSGASDRATGQVVAKLFSGERLVSQGALNLQFAGGLDDMPDPLTPGQAVDAVIEMYPTDFAVPADAPLTLVLYASDPDMWYDPDATGATLTLTGVTVELPTIERGEEDVFLVACGERIMDVVPECYQEGRIDIGIASEA